MCFEIGTLCVKVHVSINHVPLGSTPARNKRKKTINTASASQHVPPKNRVSDF